MVDNKIDWGELGWGFGPSRGDWFNDDEEYKLLNREARQRIRLALEKEFTEQIIAEGREDIFDDPDGARILFRWWRKERVLGRL